MKYVLNRTRLENLLSERKLSLTELAKKSGISRQSLYEMFEGRSLLSVPFQKLSHFLNIDFLELLEAKKEEGHQLTEAPSSIQKVALELIQFAKENQAKLILFGSRAIGKKGTAADWDFGLLFAKDTTTLDRKLRLLKQSLIEKAFPHRIDIVNLNRAPNWFRQSLSENFIPLFGHTTSHELLEKDAA